MEFKYWLEQFELKSVIPPHERTKHIWVSDPKNPQQIAAWHRQRTEKVFNFPLSKEKFIHFTLANSATEIIKNKNLIFGDVCAVSLSFGFWAPIVQFNHIITKKKEKLLSPSQIKKSKLMPKKFIGWEIPNFQEEIVAILFKTDKYPTSARAEEVIWSGSVPLIDPKIIPLRDAILLLKNTPYNKNMDKNNDFVNYI